MSLGRAGGVYAARHAGTGAAHPYQAWHIGSAAIASTIVTGKD